MEEMIKLTNGKKTIIRSKIQYEANVKNFGMRGFVPFDEVKEVKEVVQLSEDKTFENETVVQLKPKKKKAKKK